MTQATIAQKAPYPAKVEAAKNYHWCACGMSKSQPFCDGSHKGSSFTPIAYTPSLTGEVYFCGCKATKNKPLCDGSHKSL
jgi:CDGSH-type Zn-finger protein